MISTSSPLRDAYEPLILRLSPDVRGFFSIKLATTDLTGQIGLIRAEWNRFFRVIRSSIRFWMNASTINTAPISDLVTYLGLFTLLAIVVACLGLFGLASFTTAQRTKEIGIRKVLGATVGEIVEMLYREFAVLILVAFVIATPLAWYAVTQWLQSYAFRTNLPWWLFVMPFLVVLLTSLLTVSFQSIKAALTNPVKSLRSE
jgi:putative ABC transport system permease protein